MPLLPIERKSGNANVSGRVDTQPTNSSNVASVADNGGFQQILQNSNQGTRPQVAHSQVVTNSDVSNAVTKTSAKRHLTNHVDRQKPGNLPTHDTAHEVAVNVDLANSPFVAKSIEHTTDKVVLDATKSVNHIPTRSLTDSMRSVKRGQTLKVVHHLHRGESATLAAKHTKKKVLPDNHGSDQASVAQYAAIAQQSLQLVYQPSQPAPGRVSEKTLHRAEPSQSSSVNHQGVVTGKGDLLTNAHESHRTTSQTHPLDQTKKSQTWAMGAKEVLTAHTATANQVSVQANGSPAAPRIAKQVAPQVATKAAPQANTEAALQANTKVAPQVATKAALQANTEAAPQAATEAALQANTKVAPQVAASDSTALTPRTVLRNTTRKMVVYRTLNRRPQMREGTGVPHLIDNTVSAHLQSLIESNAGSSEVTHNGIMQASARNDAKRENLPPTNISQPPILSAAKALSSYRMRASRVNAPPVKSQNNATADAAPMHTVAASLERQAAPNQALRTSARANIGVDTANSKNNAGVAQTTTPILSKATVDTVETQKSLQQVVNGVDQSAPKQSINGVSSGMTVGNQAHSSGGMTLQSVVTQQVAQQANMQNASNSVNLSIGQKLSQQSGVQTLMEGAIGQTQRGVQTVVSHPIKITRNPKNIANKAHVLAFSKNQKSLVSNDSQSKSSIQMMVGYFENSNSKTGNSSTSGNGQQQNGSGLGQSYANSSFGNTLSMHAGSAQVLQAQVARWLMGQAYKLSFVGASSIVVTLIPETLGKLKLTVKKVKSGVIEVNIAASNKESFALLDGSKSNLQQQLEAGGFPSVTINMGMEQQTHQEQQDGTTKQAVVAPIIDSVAHVQPSVRFNSLNSQYARQDLHQGFNAEA